jgi:hypothetical protein
VQIGLLPNTEWLKGTRRAVAARRDRGRRARPDLAAGRVRRRRRDHRALQADRHRDGRGRQGRALWRLRPPDPLVKLASIKEAEGVPSATDMIRLLVAAQEATARTAREVFPLVDKANDQPTADLLTQRLEVHEKTAWMLRSLLEE